VHLLSIAAGLFANGLLFCLSWIVPKRPRTALIGAGLGKRYCGSPKYLFMYLCRAAEKGDRPLDDFAWITHERRIYERLRDEGKPVYWGRSLGAFWRILRSEWLVTESVPAGVGGHDIGYERIFLGRFKVAHTWHGSPLKRVCLDALRDRPLNRWYEKLHYHLLRAEFSSHHCILGLAEIDSEVLKSAFDNERVITIGYPRNDILLGDRQDWPVQRRFEQYDRVILYAPTFRDHGDPVTPFSDDMLRQMQEELAARNWCLLVKLHRFDFCFQPPAGLANIRDVSAEVEDTMELLVETDLVISDYSSIAVDYMLRDLPVIYYPYDLEDYIARSRKMYFDFHDWVPGPIARSEDEVLELMLDTEKWFQEPEYQERFQAARHKFHKYLDAGASHRMRVLLWGEPDSSDSVQDSP